MKKYECKNFKNQSTQTENIGSKQKKTQTNLQTAVKSEEFSQQVNLDLKNKTNMDIDDSYFSYVGRMLSRN